MQSFTFWQVLMIFSAFDSKDFFDFVIFKFVFYCYKLVSSK